MSLDTACVLFTKVCVKKSPLGLLNIAADAVVHILIGNLLFPFQQDIETSSFSDHMQKIYL